MNKEIRNGNKTGFITSLHAQGYGFIDVIPGESRFFHASDLQGVEFQDLREGTMVEYEESESRKGPQAIKVKVINQMLKQLEGCEVMIFSLKEKTGIVSNIRFEKRFGFIQIDGEDNEIFFHLSGLIGTKWEDLKEGQRVKFLEAENAKGSKAIGVQVINDKEER